VPGTGAVRQNSDVVVEIGGFAIRLRSDNPSFLRLLRERYAGYLGSSDQSAVDFDVELAPFGGESGDENVQVKWNSGNWLMTRGDFRAEWNPSSSRGRIQQTVNPYSLDSVLRIVHTLVLVHRGGFLVHASSAIRNGRAFLFSGASGTGKTRISRLAPPDAALLGDETSYVTCENSSYFVIGTPFFGQLACAVENLKAPLDTFYLLAKGVENKIEPITGASAVRALMANILLSSRDPEFVERVFDSALNFVSRVPVRRLTFAADSHAWGLMV